MGGLKDPQQKAYLFDQGSAQPLLLYFVCTNSVVVPTGEFMNCFSPCLSLFPSCSFAKWESFVPLEIRIVFDAQLVFLGMWHAIGGEEYKKTISYGQHGQNNNGN